MLTWLIKVNYGSTKCQLRTDTMLYASKKAKENKEIENNLEKRLQEFGKKLSTKFNIGEIEFKEYIRSKAD